MAPKTGYNAPISRLVEWGNTMVSHLFSYQLALLALVWLFLMLHVTWPKRGVTPPLVSAQPEPLPPKRTRAHEPTPFEDLTRKPHCALCERDAAHPQAPLPVPPDSMPSTNRRPYGQNI